MDSNGTAVQKLSKILSLLVIGILVSCSSQQKTTSTDSLIGTPEQWTLQGRRSGEGYFDISGTLFSFQSEAQDDNPFYQIYLRNTNSGQVQRISPGTGKTTCSWVHPNQKQVLYSSTHHDPTSLKQQKTELEFRASGKTRRYSWDYDPQYELYLYDTQTKKQKRLTNQFGYDAEGAISPDGKYIVYSSNAHAYSDKNLSAEQQELLKNQPQQFLDIYLYDLKTKKSQRLTSTFGYDGGPFFSHQGDRIVWRRFGADGHSAEVYTMKLDGTDQIQVTRLGKMSWAPFFHPSGDYIVFSSNVFGFDNFELFIVDSLGKKDPVRVTDRNGFDGLPVFHPNGNEIYWTSDQTQNKTSQIFKAKWNDKEARKLLGLPAGPPLTGELSSEVIESDLKSSISYLASPELEGRATGSKGERKAHDYIISSFAASGLKPMLGKDFRQSFEFASGTTLDESSKLSTLQIGKEWAPVLFGRNGSFEIKNLVFVGHGLQVPATAALQAYDSYKGLNVQGKWVVALDEVPEDLPIKTRAHYMRFSRAAYKATIAQSLGAVGIIFLTPSQKIGFKSSESSEQKSLFALQVDPTAFNTLLKAAAGTDLDTWQKKSDGQQLKLTNSLSGQVQLRRIMSQANNVVGWLPHPNASRYLVIGAHGDHLGNQYSSSSRALTKEGLQIHHGADDNASGMAAVIELAQHFADTKNARPPYHLVFAIWSGEELGNLGSRSFVDNMGKTKNQIAAYINMDMIGRFDDKLYIQGLGSSKDWPAVIEQAVVSFKSPEPLPLFFQPDPYLPTDSTSFYTEGIPVLSFFTGAHTDYHTPSDTAEKINYPRLGQITRFISHLIQQFQYQPKLRIQTLAQSRSSLMSPESGGRSFRIFLGTIPDYAQKPSSSSAEASKGVLLSGVIANGPAEKAGLKKGDIIRGIAGIQIDTLQDYVFALEALKPSEKVSVKVIRSQKNLQLEVVPEAR